MPILTFEGGNLPPEKKKELIVRMTETAAAATGIPEDKFVVLLRELNDQNIGIAGQTLAELKAAMVKNR